MPSIKRPLSIAGIAAVALSLAAVPVQAASPSDSTAANGVCFVSVRNSTANSVIKNISVAVGPDAPGQVAPAGSTWKYSVQVVARKGEAINVPTTSYSSYGTWSAPRITGKAPSGVSTLGDIYTVEATFTSKVAMNQSHCAPTFGWLNSSRPLRPESTILVQAVSPGGAVNAKIVAGSQRVGSYVY